MIMRIQYNRFNESLISPGSEYQQINQIILIIPGKKFFVSFVVMQGRTYVTKTIEANGMKRENGPGNETTESSLSTLMLNRYMTVYLVFS